MRLDRGGRRDARPRPRSPAAEHGTAHGDRLVGDEGRRRAQGPARARRADRRARARRADRRQRARRAAAADRGRDSFNMRDGVQLAAPGDDTIDARDGGNDEINCGAGNDVAIVDAIEDGVYDCEVVGSRAMIGRPADHSLEARPRRARRPARRPSGSRREHRDELLRRRDFLGRTAALAGLAGMAGVLPAETLVAEAAKHATRKPFPKPRDLPIDTFVVLMMENRSFDHYFGWHPQRRRQERRARATRTSTARRSSPPIASRPTSRAATSATPTTAGTAGATSTTAASSTASTAATPRAPAATSTRSATTSRRTSASSRTSADAYSSTTAGSARSWPRPTPTATTSWRRRTAARSRTSCRRRPAATASSGRRSSTGRWRAGSRSATTSPTCRSRRSTARAGCDWVRPIVAVLHRRRRGQRCRRSRFVDPPFKDGGGGDGISADEHPHGDVRLGQAFMSDVAHAFIESPAVPARGDVHQLRRVGRVLRPRQAPPRPRRPRRTATDLDERLVADRLPDPGGRDLALHARQARAGGSAT